MKKLLIIIPFLFLLSCGKDNTLGEQLHEEIQTSYAGKPPQSTQSTALVYTAIITQSGTSDPTVIVLENTIGNIVWTRGSEGTYSGTLIGAFPVNKVWFAKPSNGFEAEEFSGYISITRDSPTNTDAVLIRTNSETDPGTRVDDALFNCSIEIRVYP